jgi:hypothetical protein
MKIHGLEGLTGQDIERELRNGGRFVLFTYTISILIMTFKQPAGIYFVRGGRSAILKGLPPTILTLLLGWWGIPWGPIYSLASIFGNLSGGKDVTNDVLASIGGAA